MISLIFSREFHEAEEIHYFYRLRSCPGLRTKQIRLKKRLLMVFGTRPEAIKMAPVIRAFGGAGDRFETVVCVTAQHRGMLDQVLTSFSIHPGFDLDIMKQDQDIRDVFNRVFGEFPAVVAQAKPDLVFVHGDTTTTLAVALACHDLKVPVAHVEAGLRTYNLRAPWPEELNRQAVDRLSAYLFAPTVSGKENLLREGVREEYIAVTGNTVVDALQFIIGKIDRDGIFRSALFSELAALGYDPADRGILDKTRRMILVTGHRRESFGPGLDSICRALKAIAKSHPGCDIVYPVHPNPHVTEPVRRILQGIPGLFLLPPVRYELLILLMQLSYLVLTDSGGIQEEAPSLGKPVLVMRETSERREAIDAGLARLTGTGSRQIIRETELLLDDRREYLEMTGRPNPYGDGHAARRIVEFTKTIF